MKYEKGTGTAVPSFVATAEACQDFCAADTSMPCGYFNYDMEAESCTLFTDIGAELPSGNDWFAGARGFVTGGPDCTVQDALDAESVAINGAKGCFRVSSRSVFRVLSALLFFFSCLNGLNSVQHLVLCYWFVLLDFADVAITKSLMMLVLFFLHSKGQLDLHQRRLWNLRRCQRCVRRALWLGLCVER